MPRSHPSGSVTKSVMTTFARADIAGLAKVRANSFDVNGVERLARGHEKPIPTRTAEADIAANLRKNNLANALAVRGKDVNAVITIAHPSGTHPDVAVGVTTNAVGLPGNLFVFHIHLHRDKLAPVGELAAVAHLPNLNVFRRFLVVR